MSKIPPVVASSAISRLQELVRIPTVSRLDDDDIDWSQFVAFQKKLKNLYPNVHRDLDLELIDHHSLLFRWKGRSDESPTVLMAHYDVVAASESGWEHPPFSGELTGTAAQQLIWGRGTLDDKGSLVCIMEAVEAHLEAGFQPQNDVYLSFGHNEETAGTGARVIVDVLDDRGIRPALVLDEGGAVVEGIFPGVSKPIAVVGVSEKGILSLALRVRAQGGHASMPPKQAATVRLARAIVRLNERPFRKSFVPTNLQMIRILGAHATQPLRWVFTNLWLTKRILLALFARLSDETNAMVRTTQTVTQLSGAQAANAIAENAEAIVNIRVAIDSTVAEACDHVRRAIRDDLVEIEVLHPSEPSPVSKTSGPAWELVERTIQDAFPGTIVTPYVMLGASDSRHFTRISDYVYRFSPFEMSREERGTLHAKNERMRTATFLKGIAFYRRLVGDL